ncbi:MAG: hypothetical protein H6807_03835 [Planctomycetes bacterium]|nr:hypothetical protein [Planctomycetota bacterium]
MSRDAVTRAEAEDDREFEGLFARHRSGRTLVMTLLVGLLAILLLRGLAPAPRPSDFDQPMGWSDVVDALEAAEHDPAGRVVLFLGDSVLRANVMREQGLADAEDQTPVAWARRLADADVAFYDLSVDGMLPADIAEVIRTLQGGRVEVVIELSPRYLSPDYASRERAHSRDFFVRSTGPLKLDDQIDRLGLVHHRLGLDRTRRALGAALARPEVLLLAPPRPTKDVRSMLRNARHFLAPVEESVQLEHIREICSSFIGVNGQLLFMTPVNAAALGQAEATPPGLVAAKRAFLRVVQEGDSYRSPDDRLGITLRDFDDGTFRPEDFLDHVHLRPSANARLAARILRALDIPLKLDERVPLPSRDTFAPIAGVTGGAFLDRERILLARAEGNAMAIDLASGLEGELDIELGGGMIAQPKLGRVVFWRKDAQGRLTLVKSYGLDEFEEKTESGNWPFAEPPRFDLIGNTMLAISGRRLYRIAFDENTPDARIEGSIELPEGLGDAQPRVVGDRLYLAVPDPAGGFREIQAIGLQDLQAGRLDRFEPWARCRPDVDFDREFATAKGLRQPARDRLALPFERFYSLRSTGDAFVMEAPFPAAPEARCLWWLAIEAGVVQALVEPGADGLVLDPGGAPRRLPRRILAFDPPSGRALIDHGDGFEVMETALLHRSDWTYGAPPWPERDIVVANGFSHRMRSPEDWRVGLFGSSRVGASYPAGVPDARALRCSLSLATELTRELDRELADSPSRAQALDFSQARSDLLRCLATISQVDPGELDLLLLTIDDESLRDPDRPDDDGAPRLPERYRAIMRDESGAPLIDFQAGFRPRLRFGPLPPAATVDAKRALEDCLAEIAEIAQRKGLPLLILDLSRLSEADDPELSLLREAIAGRGLESLEARALLRAEAPEIEAYDYGRDPHLRVETIRALARALSERLAPRLWSDLFVRQARRPAAAASDGRPVGTAGGVLDPMRALREDVHLERSLIDGDRLVYDLGPDARAVAPWRRALALFGLRGAPRRAAESGGLTIEIIRFPDYDEYGLGRHDDPVVVARFLIKAVDLASALEQVESALVAEAPPSWLREE